MHPANLIAVVTTTRLSENSKPHVIVVPLYDSALAKERM